MSEYVIHCTITDQVLSKYEKRKDRIKTEWTYFDSLENDTKTIDILLLPQLDNSAIFSSVQEAQKKVNILEELFTKNNEITSFKILQIDKEELQYYTIKDKIEWASQLL